MVKLHVEVYVCLIFDENTLPALNTFVLVVVLMTFVCFKCDGL